MSIIQYDNMRRGSKSAPQVNARQAIVSEGILMLYILKKKKCLDLFYNSISEAHMKVLCTLVFLLQRFKVKEITEIFL